MKGQHLVVGLLLVAVIAGGVVAATDTDIGAVSGTEPILQGDIQEFLSGTQPETTEETAPFALTIDEIEDCGRTCRDVTATIEHVQDEPATGVTVSTTIYAGENTTAAENQVWEQTREIGTIEANDSQTVTERVSLSLVEGIEVRRNDGWITIQTTVESDEETVTMRRTRDIS